MMKGNSTPSGFEMLDGWLNKNFTPSEFCYV